MDFFKRSITKMRETETYTVFLTSFLSSKEQVMFFVNKKILGEFETA